ncbi:hypothetical protein D3C72_1238110 [compost metagenome]
MSVVQDDLKRIEMESHKRWLNVIADGLDTETRLKLSPYYFDGKKRVGCMEAIQIKSDTANDIAKRLRQIAELI